MTTGRRGIYRLHDFVCLLKYKTNENTYLFVITIVYLPGDRAIRVCTVAGSGGHNLADGVSEEQAYQYALDIFNQTVANLSSIADLAKGDVIRELDDIQAASYDPGDTGAYDLTMYGVNQISGIKDHVVDTIGNASNYAINNSSAVSLQTEHTAISGSASAPIDSFGSLVSHAVSDPGQFVQTNSIGFMILGVVFSLLLAKFLFLRR